MFFIAKHYFWTAIWAHVWYGDKFYVRHKCSDKCYDNICIRHKHMFKYDGKISVREKSLRNYKDKLGDVI